MYAVNLDDSKFDDLTASKERYIYFYMELLIDSYKKRLKALYKSLTFENRIAPRLHVWSPSNLCGSLEAHGYA
ncbi:hypothetical protein EYC80_007538 [Monilinia laxa]|uniref:Uncharacterized protein n=1 Tax=Monilinia laxa TaxID=61186 RepID=A0A5N6JW86_MONLA|nr:hypothetical protein EYC80_007538 [Monilinia laxa]